MIWIKLKNIIVAQHFISTIKSLGMAIIASAIFYTIVMYFPEKRKNKIALNFFADLYKTEKTSIFGELIHFLSSITNKSFIYQRDKNGVSLSNKISSDILNYEIINKAIFKEDYYTIRNECYGNTFFQLTNTVLYHLNTLRSHTISMLSYDFIRRNKEAYRRCNFLINWIQQANHFKETYYTKGTDDYDYSKIFCNSLWEFVCGWSLVDGQKNRDDFVAIIKKAYQSSLISNRLLRLCSLCLQTPKKLWRKLLKNSKQKSQ